MKRKLLKKSVAFVLIAILVTGTTVCAEEPAEGDITEVEQPANPPNDASLDDMDEPIEPATPESPVIAEKSEVISEEPTTEIVAPVEQPKQEPPTEGQPPANNALSTDELVEHKTFTLTVIDKVLGTDDSVISSEVRSEQTFDEGAIYLVKALSIEGTKAEGATEYTGAISEDMSIEFLYRVTEADGNINIVADKYTVTFDSNGGTPAPAQQEIEDGGKVTEPTPPTKAGHRFVGWSYTGLWDFDNDTVSGDIQLYANWEEGYLVTFDTQGGTPVDSRFFRSGSWEDARKIEAVAPKPKKEGYRLTGWTYKGNPWDIKNGVVSEDMTLVAQWQAFDTSKDKYTVSFDSEGGTSVASQQVKSGEKVEKPVDPTKDGYVFKCWMYVTDKSDIGGGASEWQFDSDVVTEDVELYATWNEAVTVTFDSNGGTPVEAVKVVKWHRANEPVPPTKEGYRFLKWTYNGADWDFKRQSVDEDITLVAQWEKIKAIEVHPSPTVKRPENKPTPPASHPSPVANRQSSGSHPSPVANRPDVNVPEPKMGDMYEFPVYMVFGVLMVLELLIKKKR